MGAVAGADALVRRRDALRGRARAAIGPVAEAETMEAPAPLLEEGDHCVERVERAHAEAGVVAAQRMRPARVALFAPRRQRHDVGAPGRPSDTSIGKRISWNCETMTGASGLGSNSMSEGALTA